MENMSDIFLETLSLSGLDNEQIISLYDEELFANPANIAALKNRGIRKLDLAMKKKDKVLLQQSRLDFEKCLGLMKKNNYHHSYHLAWLLMRSTDSNLD